MLSPLSACGSRTRGVMFLICHAAGRLIVLLCSGFHTIHWELPFRFSLQLQVESVSTLHQSIRAPTSHFCMVSYACPAGVSVVLSLAVVCSDILLLSQAYQ